MDEEIEFKPEECSKCGASIPPTRETCPICYTPGKKYVEVRVKSIEN